MPRTSSTWSVNDQITAARLQAFNTDLDDLYSKGSDRGRIQPAISGTALKIDIGAFAWRVGSTSGQYSGGTDISVTNSATNYVEIDATGTIQINTSGWTTIYGRLGTVTCSGGAITAISIWKADVIGGNLGTSTLVNVETLSAAKSISSTDKYSQFLNLNGTDRVVTLETSNMSEGQSFYIKNNGTSGLMQVKQASTTLLYIPPGQYAIFTYDGTNWQNFYFSLQTVFSLTPQNGMQSPSISCGNVKMQDAITFGGAVTDTGSGLPITKSLTTSGSRITVVLTVSTNTGTITGATFNGVAMTQLGQQTRNGTTCTAYIMSNAPAGTYNIVVSGTATTASIAAGYYNSTSDLRSYEVVGSGTADSVNSFPTDAQTSVSDNVFMVVCSAHSANDTVTSSGNSIRAQAGGASLIDNNTAKTPPGSITSMTVARSGGGATYWSWVNFLLIPVSNGLQVFDFDKDQIEQAEWQMLIPPYFYGTTFTAKFHWITSAASGDVVWKIQAVSVADGTVYDTAYGTAQSVTDSSTGSNKVNISSATSTVTIGGSAFPGQPIWFRVYRDATNGSDTLAADARLLSVEITFAY